jgi:hypothetical protein
MSSLELSGRGFDPFFAILYVDVRPSGFQTRELGEYLIAHRVDKWDIIVCAWIVDDLS